MSRQRPADIYLELVELCGEFAGEIRQQLSYYRASVYKQETAINLRSKIDQLRLLADLFGDETVSEPLHDYDAMAALGASVCAPGECSFSWRVSVLVNSLEKNLVQAHSRAAIHDAVLTLAQDFAQTVRRRRRELLALCRHGSRTWALFQNL